MAMLLLSDAEKAAASYLDWDDDALGKFTKKIALTLVQHKDDAEGLHKVTAASACLLLIGAAHQANAANLKMVFEGHTHAGIETGDWVITVKRTRKPKPSKFSAWLEE